MFEFKSFGKIPRLFRNCFISEKIDGTNAQIIVSDDGKSLVAASRSRIITPQDDNFGFAAFVEKNKEELLYLGPGHHYGEWWGKGIGKRHPTVERKFSLFNVTRWGNVDTRPRCCDVVPMLASGLFSQKLIDDAMDKLKNNGSMADPNCKRPEGIIVYHEAANLYFKITCENDESPKGTV